MIQAIVLDVDGVFIGEKIGYNFPDPHPEVIKTFKQIRERGIPIILCTAKPYKSIEKVIESAKLHNVHIADGGAVLYDPLDKAVLEETIIEKETAKKIIQICLDNRTYIEFYTLQNYYVQKDEAGTLTEKHIQILQFSPTIVDSLTEESTHHAITKIMPITRDEKERDTITKLLKPFTDTIALAWGSHPYVGTNPFGIITNKNVSKKVGFEKVIKSLNIPFEDVLSVGDSVSDWKFMELTGYVGTLENAKDELKELVKTKGEGHFAIGKSVDENGLLDIFDYFLSLKS